MTRETKIGLLVGLAFIIVIGILLEDHFSSVNEPKPAPLAMVGPNVRAGTGNPGGDSNSTLQAQEGAPHNEVPIGHDNQRHVTEIRGSDSRTAAPRQDNGIADVHVGPGGGNTLPPASQQRLPGQQDPGPARSETPATPRGSEGTDDLTAWAHNAGEPLERVDAHGRRIPERTNESGAAAGTGQEYVAVAGDSLSKMARKYFGADTKANREAIVRANPSLQQDPNKVIVGQSYIMPGNAPASAPPAPRTADIRTPEVHTPPAAPANTENWYTTRQGDSLSRIAVDQCGTPAAVAAIKQLNPEKFTNGNTNVQAGWKLRLPTKTVASAGN